MIGNPNRLLERGGAGEEERMGEMGEELMKIGKWVKEMEKEREGRIGSQEINWKVLMRIDIYW